ncbi:tyrosine-type recombinase/integrase [Flavonifractor plautii]|uniref:tyrosine-type recombinase/integrase n=1 Tax=Flavonifractor plautii TaxID=292800 RepID=UPI0039B54346
MVTVGKTPEGKPICKPLKPESYFATYNDAYAALVEYNKNPYDLEPSITMQELYDKWLQEYEKTVKSTKSVTSAWAYCSGVYKMRVMDIRARHVKGCMEEGVAIIRGKEQHPSATMKNQIKSLFNMMLDYALEYELVDRNYSRTFNLTEETVKEIQSVKKEHIAFTDEEMDLLWANISSKQGIDIMLIQCYSGWRPQELGLLELKDVDLENRTFRGGMKTDAGENRVVPIHSRIQDLVLRKYQEAEALGSPYLLNWTDPNNRNKKNLKLTYARYQKAFERIRDELKLNPNHRPHDGRTHFVTMAKRYGVDEYAIKYMVGHKISDITEKVYTRREFAWLREEIEKIK